jgi:hypothetical protein
MNTLCNAFSVSVSNAGKVLIALVTSFVLVAAQAQAKEDVLHGADGIFVSPDASIIWAVLKQPTGDKAAVWLRVVNSTRKFTHVSIDGVEAGTKLGAEVRVSSDRDTFSDLPSREVHFYLTESDLHASKAALTVYYLGVPDTTPEFSTRTAMDQYFNTVKLINHKVAPKQ